MKPQALDKAARRLTKMTELVKSMSSAAKPEHLESAWEDFVIASGGFYSALEQGSKGCGKSAAWFGRKKHERNLDPLLQYLHQARNAEEHGIQHITRRSSSSISIASQGGYAKLEATKDGWKVTETSGEVKFANDIVRLTSVFDGRSKRWFDVPEIHLGAKIESRTPSATALLALKHFTGVLQEASELCVAAAQELRRNGNRN